MMGEGYVLEWLDTLVTVTLNPVKKEITADRPKDIAKIRDQILFEKDQIQSAIKSTVFNLNDEAKIKCLIKKYHSSLIALLDQALEDQAALHITPLKRVLDTIVSSIDELLSLIENRFKSYLSVKERVPVTYLAVVKKELNKKLSSVSGTLSDHMPFQPAFGIMMQELETFLNYPDNHYCTFQEIFYMKDLFRELERLEPVYEDDVYSALDMLLICMNFNSNAYIQNLTQRVATHINELDQTTEKIERLLFYLKLFKQTHRKPDIIFHSKDAGLYPQVENWFSQEIFYLEKQIHYSITPLKKEVKKKVTKHKERQKVLSMLSVDQMALILRAADDLRIIMARSLSSVFKSIAPHLSTPYKENISYDSMRSKSYSAESRDKEIAIETLQQIIKKIKEY